MLRISGQECYCGNVINAGSVNQTSSDPAVNGCNMVCAANSTEYCGGRSLLNMYQVAPIVSSSNSTSVPTGSVPLTSSISSSVFPSTTPTGNISQSPSSSSQSTYTFTNSSTASVALPTVGGISPTPSYVSSSNTYSNSSSVASATSLSVSTLYTTTSSSPTAVSSTGWSNSSTTTSAPLWTGTPTPGQTIGTWEYLGCADEVDGRALTGSSYSNDTAMTIEACQSYCDANNYGLAGLEYSSQVHTPHIPAQVQKKLTPFLLPVLLRELARLPLYHKLHRLQHALHRQPLTALRRTQPSQPIQPDHLHATPQPRPHKLLHLPRLFLRKPNDLPTPLRRLPRQQHFHDARILHCVLQAAADAGWRLRGRRVRAGVLLRGGATRDGGAEGG